MKLSGQASTSALFRTVAGAAAKAGLVMALLICVQARAQVATSSCGALGKPFGDYLVDKDKVAMSAGFHFTPEVESLVRGKSTNIIGADIDFTLIAFPNHHRALVAMMRIGEKQKSPQPAGAKYTVECYFDRAIRFRPDDTVVRLLYATFLLKNAREADAAAQLEWAAKAATDDPFAQYNIGMIYLDMKNFDRALEQAHKAYELGFGRTELRDRLRSAGQWRDPELAVLPSGPNGRAPAVSDSSASAAK